MSFWSIVLLLIKYGPTVYAIVKEIIELIRGMHDAVGVAQCANWEFALDRELEAYERTPRRQRCTSGLEALRAQVREAHARVIVTPIKPA